MSTTIKKAAKKEPERSTSEDMAAEAVKPVKPKASPPVVPFAALSRRAKSAFFGHFQKVLDQSAILNGLTGIEEPSSGDVAVLYEVLADIEDALTTVAVDGDAMAAWLTRAEDDQLLELLFWYADRFQVGEAGASPT